MKRLRNTLIAVPLEDLEKVLLEHTHNRAEVNSARMRLTQLAAARREALVGTASPDDGR